MKALYLTLLTLMIIPAILRGQCIMIPLSLENQMSQSDVVVEGEIVSSTGFETTAGNFIYTHYEIRITKVFKGNVEGDLIDLVEPGGTVGERSVQVDPGVTLENGQRGMFFLSKYSFKDTRDQSLFTTPVYRCYGCTQSVFMYDHRDNKVTSIFMQHPLSAWYPFLHEQTGATYTEIHPLIWTDVPHLRMVPTISSLSPTTITAGTFSILTINGNGFGASVGSSGVEFKNADDGGTSWFSATTTHIQSWSNTQIQIRVPYSAGSGQVRVTVGGMSVISSQSLTIQYNQFNVEFEANGSNYIFKRQLYNNNGTGGFTFQYHTEFNSNTPARKSFERALNSWRCGTEVNFTIGATTIIDDDVEDGFNVIRYDNGDELPAGVGAHCVSYINYCVVLAPYFANHVKEIDLVFNDDFAGYPWEYGPELPSAGEFDFETIALHELGHACALGHVISPPEVMHYGVGPGEVKRVLSSNDIAGGLFVQAQSTGNPAYCDNTPMTDYRQVKYVNQAATGIESGDSWSQAYKKLQDALGAVTNCVDTIYVAAGFYYPDEGVGYTNNNQDHRFVLDKTVVLMGGYASATGVRNLNTNYTVLSGDIDQDNVTDADNSHNVVRMTANATLDGFWIDRGYADASSGDGRDGGGIYNSSSGTIRNTIFRFNKAVGNGSTGRGGAFYQASGNPTLTNILVFGCEATQTGNAFHLQGGVLNCYNCTIANNDGPAPTAVHIADIFHVFLNCIFWQNGGDMSCVSPPASADVSYSLFQDAGFAPGVFGGGVLFGVDPMFDANFTLFPCSPGINSGANLYNNTTTDIIGNPRFVGTIDRGAYEHVTGPPSTIVTTASDNVAGSLRTIIANACPGNTITFSPSLMNQTLLLNGPQLMINKNLTINGLGMNQLSISGNEFRRIFNINTGITATIRDMSLIEGNGQSSFGNCIRSSGNLTLENMRMSSYSGAEFTYSIYSNAGNIIFKNQIFME